MRPHPPTIVRALLAWFERNARDLPWRRTTDPYAVWVSEIMLQQTQVKTVLPYWERWMRALPTIRHLAEAGEEQLHKLWEGLGYYTRVRNLQRAARQIMSDHKGVFPSDYDQVLALPGIGRYTAGAICSIAFDQPKPILDGNVMRVLTRLFALRGNPHDKVVNEKLWALAEQLVSVAARSGNRRFCSHLNQSLMELGALVCTPRKPVCAECPLSRLCLAALRKLTDKIPALPSRPKAISRKFFVFVVSNRGRFLVQRRPDGMVNARLWEFPAVEVNGTGENALSMAERLLGKKPARLVPLCTIKHTITRYRITTEALLLEGPVTKQNSGRWLPLQQLHRLPFTSAHRRIIATLTVRVGQRKNI